MEQETISASDVLKMVMQSYFHAKNGTNPQTFAERWGIEGSFVKKTVPVPTLVKMVQNHRLFISPSKREEGVLEKVKSGHRNPVIITKVFDSPYPFTVVDGTHSLDAAARAGDKTIEVIMPVDVDL